MPLILVLPPLFLLFSASLRLCEKMLLRFLITLHSLRITVSREALCYVLHLQPPTGDDKEPIIGFLVVLRGKFKPKLPCTGASFERVLTRSGKGPTT